MDEVLFRSSQKIENIQLHAELAARKTKDVFLLYSEHCKIYVLKLWDSVTSERLKDSVQEFYIKVITITKDIQYRLIHITSPSYLYRNLVRVFGKKWTKRDIYFGCAGFLIGSVVGIAIGLTLRRKEPILRYMQAIQHNERLDTESVTVVEDAIAPYECGDYDVLINVKAASVQIIDVEICKGYGKVLRNILQKIYKQSNSELAVILGRDCTGIVTDLGSKVKRLEVGDEVWLAVPFWSQGTLCQTVLVSENRVSRKPKNIGFEGACSLPYAGSLALSALSEAGIDSSNACEKNILVQGGCTPVGCVLLQLLKHWKATVTTSCYKRAVPVVKALGACDIIIMSEPSNLNNKSFVESEDEHQVVCNALLKELEIRSNLFDIIIITNNDNHINIEDLKKFCIPDGVIISTLPPVLSSNSYGFISRSILSLFINLKYKIQFLLGSVFDLISHTEYLDLSKRDPNILKTFFADSSSMTCILLPRETILGMPLTDFDETHLCNVKLDKLTEFVEQGCLQTVVDKVFLPQDIEVAINHIQSPLSIGSTVISFR